MMMQPESTNVVTLGLVDVLMSLSMAFPTAPAEFMLKVVLLAV